VTLAADNKPYRLNVGIALFNGAGFVLIGRRFRDDGPEIILPGLEWQMPQGGVDPGEDLHEAAMRELWEETGVANAHYLGETDWLTYEFPPFAVPPSHRLAKFRGQRQKWFALRFKGSEDPAQRPAGRIRCLAMGAARPRARSRGAVSARGVPDGGQQICKIWRPVVLRCEPGGRRRDRLKCHSRGWDRQYVSILLKRLAGELQCDNTSP